MLMTRRQSFETWAGVVNRQLQILYEVEADMFKDVYNLQKAYDDNKPTRLVVEELALILE
jgi:hypothetical protein